MARILAAVRVSLAAGSVLDLIGHCSAVVPARRPFFELRALPLVLSLLFLK